LIAPGYRPVRSPLLAQPNDTAIVPHSPPRQHVAACVGSSVDYIIVISNFLSPLYNLYTYQTSVETCLKNRPEPVHIGFLYSYRRPDRRGLSSTNIRETNLTTQEDPG